MTKLMRPLVGRLGLLTIGLALAGLALGLSGCLFRVPYNGNEPRISLQGVNWIPRVGTSNRDTLRVNIRYEDGNADLGLNTSDLSADDFRDPTPSGARNPWRNNYYISVEFKRPAESSFRLLTVDSSRFPRLTNEAGSPISGDMAYSVSQPFISSGQFPVQTQFRISVQIADRAKNLSNRLETIFIKPI